MTADERAETLIGRIDGMSTLSPVEIPGIKAAIVAAVREAVAAEREACLDLVENWMKYKLSMTIDGWQAIADEDKIAAAIRSRS